MSSFLGPHATSRITRASVRMTERYTKAKRRAVRRARSSLRDAREGPCTCRVLRAVPLRRLGEERRTDVRLPIVLRERVEQRRRAELAIDQRAARGTQLETKAQR